METCAFIDAFPAFLSYWAEAQEQSLESQIGSWASVYMAPWPELLRMQIKDYSAQSLDWRQIARDKVFPFLAKRLPQMERYHQYLVIVSKSIYARAQQTHGFDSLAVLLIGYLSNPSKWFNPEFSTNYTSGRGSCHPAKLSNLQTRCIVSNL